MSEEEKKNGEEKQPKNEENNNQSEEKDKKSREEKEKEIQDLLKQLKELEQKKQSSQKSNRSTRGMIMIEFGSRFHQNGIINFAMYFFLNLVVIYGLSEIFDFVSFSGHLVDLLAFVGVYTLIEVLFRHYIVFNHFKFVLKTLGFIFFFGYLTLFYLLEHYLFIGMFNFTNETTFVIFIGSFVVFRYLLSHFIRNIILRYMMRW